MDAIETRLRGGEALEIDNYTIFFFNGYCYLQADSEGLPVAFDTLDQVLINLFDRIGRWGSRPF